MHGARLIARVDEHQEEVYLKGLNHDTNYGVATNLPSVVLVGGEYFYSLLHKITTLCYVRYAMSQRLYRFKHHSWT